MEIIETLCEEEAINRVNDGLDLWLAAEWLINHTVIPFTRFIVENPWIIVIVLIAAFILNIVLKRKI